MNPPKIGKSTQNRDLNELLLKKQI